jgi:hypothetical protein
MTTHTSEAEDGFEYEVEDELQIEVEDDTPEADRGRDPMPKELVEELEADELEDYSEKVKTRLKQMKKVWHDERRDKERAMREQQEAVAFAQRALEENQRLRSTLNYGEQTLVASWSEAAELEAAAARNDYKAALEAGDTDAVVGAQERMNAAQYRLAQLRGYRPTVQAEQPMVQNTQVAPAIPKPDPKTLAWQERNSWWGTDSEMTATALGLHQKLERNNGSQYVGTDEYWQAIDTTMRRRFPEYFGGNDAAPGARTPNRAGTKAGNVVAPASRSTAPKTIRLKQSQVNIAKRLGITPEQYARELAKTGN